MKSGFPYLVDIKLTEACPFGCTFCYQSSTKDGKHANPSNLYSVANILRKANVLEVNFGGGEPTLYAPSKYQRFSCIAKTFKDFHFNVGLTTKNYNWHKSPDFAESMKYVDSVAVSVNNTDDYKRSQELMQAIYETGSCKAYTQLIFGLTPWDEFKALVESLADNTPYYSNITFLGFKDFGFATDSDPHIYPDEWIQWIASLQKEKHLNIGVDSIMVSQWRDKLVQAGVNANLLVGREGSSSCYIDAVKLLLYPSSFSKDHEGVMMPLYDEKKFIEEFRAL